MSPLANVSMLKSVGADALYCYLSDFLTSSEFNKPDFEKLVAQCREHHIPLYLSTIYKVGTLDQENLIDILQTISSTNIEGLIIEDYGILSIIKENSLFDSKKLVLGPELNIHNVETVNLLSKFNPFAYVINEEILLKNVSRIKKLSKQKIWIDINHSSPLIKFVYRWGIDFVRINSSNSFNNETIKATKYLKKIINDLTKGNEAHLEYLKEISDATMSINHPPSYKINHFSRMVINEEGKRFELKDNVKSTNWNNFIDNFAYPPTKFDIKQNNMAIRIRLSKLSQVHLLKEFQKNNKVNLIDIIEFGDIISSSDIAKEDFTDIIKSIKKICQEIGVMFYLTTPKILIERDFERLVNAANKLCLDKPQPNALIVNNPGLFKILSQNQKLINFKIEAGEGIHINNKDTCKFFKDIFPINGAFFNLSNLETTPNYVCDLELNRKSALLLGISKVLSYGMCPINTDMPYSSSLDCNAACQNGTFSIQDPHKNSEYPMILDGFCRPHLINNVIENNFRHLNKFVSAGITDLIIDCRGLPDNITKDVLDLTLNSIRYCINV